MSTVQAIRTVLFYLLLSASAFVWGTLSFFIAPILPFRARYRFVVQNWCRFAIWLTRVVAGIRYEVRGPWPRSAPSSSGSAIRSRRWSREGPQSPLQGALCADSIKEAPP